MITKIALLTAGLVAATARAETYAELNLKVGIQVSASGTKHHKTGTLKCNPAGRSPDTEHFDAGPVPGESTAGNGRVSDTTDRRYRVTLNYADAHWMTPRDMNVHVENSVADGNETVKVELQDHLKLTQSNTNEGDCSHTDWNAAASKDKMNGTIRLVYKMPANVWAVRVKRALPTGIFGGHWDQTKSPLSAIKGNLVEALDPQVATKDFVVWAQPGTEISQNIEFNDLTMGGPANGAVAVTFIPITREEFAQESGPFKLKLNETTDPKVLLQMLSQDLTAMEGNSSSLDQKTRFLEHTVSLMSHPALLTLFTKNSRTDDMQKLTKRFGNVARGGRIDENAGNVQIAATLMAFELSRRLLDDIGPFCDSRTLDLAFTGTQIRVSGLRLAYVYLARAQARIENYRFSQYHAYLDQLSEWQKAGLSYASVRTNATKFRQLQEAYEVLRTSLGDQVTPFRAALDELRLLLTQFKSVGAGEAATESIVGTLNTLAGQEDQFVRDFVLRLRQFRASNESSIQASDLLERLDKIEDAQSKVSNLLKNNVRFLSVDENSDAQSFIGMIQELISSNVNIFKKPLKYSIFEPVRKLYIESSAIEKTVTQAEKCLLDGVAQ